MNDAATAPGLLFCCPVGNNRLLSAVSPRLVSSPGDLPFRLEQPHCPQHSFPMTRQAVTTALLFAVLAGPVRAEEAGLEFFEKHIRPVLVEHCFSCHSEKANPLKGGLRLDASAGIRRGGDSGAVLVPGKPEESLLIEALLYSGEFVDMPPKGRLPARVVEKFCQWIESGAALPDDGKDVSPAPHSEVDAARIERGRRFWSFQPVRELPGPAVSQPAWPLRKLDRFILARLDENGLAPAPPADRRTLIRRLCFDLTGLPPSWDQVEAFVNDDSPNPVEALVEKLLASPAFGERWARHWLDVARYAEDNPTSESTCKPPPYPWPYRDWVIRALNEDLPYDEFVRRQLAADLLPLPPAEVAATGFLGLSPVYHKEPKLSKAVISVIVADEWDERIDTVTRSFLGLTVACARCHDHKFDPIRMEDYYALAGVMANTRLVEWPLVETSLDEARALTETREAIVDLELRVSYAGKMKIAAEIEKRPTDPYVKEGARFQKQLDEVKARSLFDGPMTTAVSDEATWIDGSDPDWTQVKFRPGESLSLPVFLRGNPNNPGEIVPRRFIEVLSTEKPTPFGDGSGRRELAEAIVTDAAPLAARVIVNRVWGWHFGQPLVRTPSNFGSLGDRPSHPRLLDDLAARFIASGWSLKWLHREIVLSATYRQASRIARASQNDATQEIDAANRLLWRMNRRRLEPEAWRDAVLAISRRLEPAMYGRSAKLDDAHSRRTIYGQVSRQNPPAVLQLFDFPDSRRHTASRTLTTTPLQQLFLLNSPFVQQAADRIAAAEPARKTPRETASSLFRRILLREPTPTELDAAVTLAGSPEPDWTILAHSLLATSEFLFVD